MAPRKLRSGLGPLAPSGYSSSDQTEGHPALSATIFAHYVHTTGGATMNLRTGDILKPKTTAYMVGGEPDRSGKRIGTLTTLGQPGLGDVIAQRRRLSGMVAGKPDESLGAWTGGDTPAEHPGEPVSVQWDASTKHPDLPSAMRLARKRNEQAVFDAKNERDIKNTDYDPKKKQS